MLPLHRLWLAPRTFQTNLRLTRVDQSLLCFTKKFKMVTIIEQIEKAHEAMIFGEVDVLDFISECIESLSIDLWPINIKIHDNPELNYKEFIAHETLTLYLKTRRGWGVTSSAFGIRTAFKAEYDSGRPGPVVSFNAEYGEQHRFFLQLR